MILRAAFFDQDGILFNSMPFHAQAWQQAMTDNGLPFTAMDAYRNEGRTGKAVIQEAFLKLHPDTDCDLEELAQKIYKAKSEYFIQLTGGQLPDCIDGVKEVLAWLKAHDVQCWVVTGSGQRSLFERVNDVFPGIFTGIISAFDVTHGKPDPEPYLKAWEKSGVAKDECIVIENAPLGVRAGKAAGLFTIAVNTGILPNQLLHEEHADLVCPNMPALLDWLNSAL